MYSIGEFSKITSLSIKSLRLYHEKEILIPASVDEVTSYRYYDDENIEKAGAISQLKKFGFSLVVIKKIMDGYEKGDDILQYLANQKKHIQSKIKEYRQISQSIDQIILMEKQMKSIEDNDFDIEEKHIKTLLIAGMKMKGQYHEVGKGFQTIGKSFARHITGKPMTLYYDGEYKEEDAEFEPCFPVRKGSDKDSIRVRELPGAEAVTLIHKGPYEKLGRSYKKIFSYISAKGYETILPFREKYIKSPGFLFKGNRKNYLTEIIIPVITNRVKSSVP